MENEKNGIRGIKKKVRELLGRNDVENALTEIKRFSPKQVVNPLFSFFYSTDELIRWRAVTAMGMVVAALADKNMESARVVMRRLMWNLNDESGGIGWGSPEAMGEIMARHRKLAEEYHRILISYMDPRGNYIEHENLQKGVLWGIGRMAHAHPDLLQGYEELLLPYARSADSDLRGLAAWAASGSDSILLRDMLKGLENDHAAVSLFINGELKNYTVAYFAGRANGNRT